MAASRKEEKYVDLGARYGFEPWRQRPWAYSMHQPANSLMILEGGSHSTLARLEKPATCTRGFRYWCSASMLSYCTTVCQPLTARIDDRTHFLIFYSIF